MGGDAMIKLYGSVDKAAGWNETFLGRVTHDRHAPVAIRRKLALLSDECPDPEVCRQFGLVLVREASTVSPIHNVHKLPDWASYLAHGDVIHLAPSGLLGVLFRVAARSNSILVTERCSSNCIMCSQPPKAKADTDLYDLAIAAIEHIPANTAQIGVTGGEPLIDVRRFLSLVHRCRTHLPRTALHVLTNGRLLSYLRYAQSIAAVRHPDLMFGIPLYSAVAARHDFVVQARGAFDQTVRGILAAKRFGLRVEIRVVLHRQTVEELGLLAEFIRRNLPFVDHVALMGLEHIGYVKMNQGALKMQPQTSAEQIVEFVELLDGAGLRTSIYNMPHCWIPEPAWRFLRQSISDWKNDFPTECGDCSMKQTCCGFFSWNVAESRELVRPIRPITTRSLTATGVTTGETS
jgi:His-Xaa-Ser system radical SAM maturase HxsC